MIAELAARIGAEAAAPRTARDLLGDQRDGAVEADREDLFAVLHIGVGLVVQHIGAETADAGDDRFPILRMLADLARQRQQLQREREIDRGGLGALGQAGALGLLAVLRLAELDIGSEAAGAERDLETGLGVVAELLRRLHGAFARGGERASVAALGIVRAADEGAELAELDRELARSAHRALARIA